ncbi:Hypothetical protein EIN_319440, partial [Entamoeba invadens IP1]
SNKSDSLKEKNELSSSVLQESSEVSKESREPIYKFEGEENSESSNTTSQD